MFTQATTYLVLGFLVGGLSGFLLTRFYCRKILQTQKILQQKLKHTEQAYRDHQEQVTKHFGQTASIFNQLTANYQNLYQHLAHGSQALCSVEQPIEFQHTKTAFLTKEALEPQGSHKSIAKATATSSTKPTQDFTNKVPPKDYFVP